MRKILIIMISLVLAGATALLLVFSLASSEAAAPADTTAITASGAAETVAAEPPTVATEPSTEPSTEPPTVATEPPTEPLPEPPDMSGTTARHIFVYDVEVQRLLYTKGDQQLRIEPASLTKLFTAYVAMQYLDPSDVVTVGEEATWIGKNSSVAAVSQGCRLSAGMIMQGMLMQSGNDAAYALAVAAGRAIAEDPGLGARAACNLFMEEVNRQLEELGIENTHFTTPDGYHERNHYTTAEDLMKIALLVVQDPLIMESCRLVSTLVTYESGQQYKWVNTNKMLHETSQFYCPEATGLKTGATAEAGKCLIASFSTGQTTLVIGVLGCATEDQRFEYALKLFEHYR